MWINNQATNSEYIQVPVIVGCRSDLARQAGHDLGNDLGSRLAVNWTGWTIKMMPDAQRPDCRDHVWQPGSHL